MPSRHTVTTAQSQELTRQTRTEQLTQIQELLPQLEAHFKKVQTIQTQTMTLDSVSRGLYDEIDKLSKKAPAETVTDLALEQVNDVIRETKELFVDDVYIQRLKVFVPAGDNPEHRDVVIVLRQVRQGLERHHKDVQPIISYIKNKIQEAQLFKQVLKLYLDGKRQIKKESVDRPYSFLIDSPWFDTLGEFKFEHLDKLNFAEYFREALAE